MDGANSAERAMSYRLSEAAAACSLTKSTVRRAIKTGKVSATKDAHGQWHIEPAELHRVYPPRTEASADERIRAYRAEIALLRDRIEDLKTLTDEFRVWVRDLTEQRDRAEVRATELDKRLLAYQPPVPALPAPRLRWWRRFASASAGTSINLAKAILRAPPASIPAPSSHKFAPALPRSRQQHLNRLDVSASYGDVLSFKPDNKQPV